MIVNEIMGNQEGRKAWDKRETIEAWKPKIDA